MTPKRRGQEIELQRPIEAPYKIESKEAKDRMVELREKLDKIKARDGVIGYILRDATSASVDIKDPSKIIDYAVLSAAAMECEEGLSNAFKLGRIDRSILEAKNIKMLFMKLGEHRLSVFMEKTVDHNSIYKGLK